MIIKLSYSIHPLVKQYTHPENKCIRTDSLLLIFIVFALRKLDEPNFKVIQNYWIQIL